MSAMTEAERDAFLAEARIAMLVTLYADGAPSAVPVWYEWDGERARIFTSRGSAKVKRIQADARVCLNVAEPAGVPEAWVSLEGTARIEEEGGYALAERLARRYYAPEKAERVLPSWKGMADQWIVLVIEPRRILSHPRSE